MLPKKSRIPRKMFSLLLKQAKFFGNDLFLLRFNRNQHLGSRFGVSVSKKVAKKAVTRNKLRRSGYALIAKNIPNIKKDIIALLSFKKIPTDKISIEVAFKEVFKRGNLM